MKTIIQYLDDLKDKVGSDNKVANMLGIERSTIANIRRRQLMSDETAVKVADLLGVSQSEVLVAAAIARSTGEVKTAWEKISRLSGITAGFLVTTPILNALSETLTGAFCILCKIVERRKNKTLYLDYIEYLTLPRQDHEFIPRRR